MGADVFEVEQILNSRQTSDGSSEYLIQWAGFGPSHNSWEPAANILDEELIKAFEVRRADPNWSPPAEVAPVEPTNDSPMVDQANRRTPASESSPSKKSSAKKEKFAVSPNTHSTLMSKWGIRFEDYREQLQSMLSSDALTNELDSVHSMLCVDAPTQEQLAVFRASYSLASASDIGGTDAVLLSNSLPDSCHSLIAHLVHYSALPLSALSQQVFDVLFSVSSHPSHPVPVDHSDFASIASETVANDHASADMSPQRSAKTLSFVDSPVVQPVIDLTKDRIPLRVSALEVRSAILLVAERRPFGMKSSKVKAQRFDDMEAQCMWRWEARHTLLRSYEQLNRIKATAARFTRKVGALHDFISGLQHRTDDDAKLTEKSDKIAQCAAEEEKLKGIETMRIQKEAEKRQKEEEKRLREEEKKLKDADRKLKEEERKQKAEAERKMKEEEKKVQEEEKNRARLLKEQEKAEKEKERLEKLEKSKKEKEDALKAKIKTSGAPITSFFVKTKASPEVPQGHAIACVSDVSDQTAALDFAPKSSFHPKFLPFQLPAHCIIAPISRDGCIAERKPCRGPKRMRLLQFSENQRPAYYGSWKRKSAFVAARRPFGRDSSIDYECDSDDEWCNEPEDAESLASGDEEEEEELDPEDKRADGLEEDGWVSTDSERDDADSDNERIALEPTSSSSSNPSNPAKRRKLRELKASIIGPCFDVSDVVNQDDIAALSAFRILPLVFDAPLDRYAMDALRRKRSVLLVPVASVAPHSAPKVKKEKVKKEKHSSPAAQVSTASDAPTSPAVAVVLQPKKKASAQPKIRPSAAVGTLQFPSTSSPEKPADALNVVSGTVQANLSESAMAAVPTLSDAMDTN